MADATVAQRQAVVVTPEGVAHQSIHCEHVGHDRVEDLTMYENLDEARKRVGERLQLCECLSMSVENPGADDDFVGFGLPRCQKCGKVIPQDTRVCPHCGRPTSDG